jgi:hypothetical protein
MAIVVCMHCGKPKPVAPWKSTRVVKVAFCAKCKPQPFKYKAVKVIGFVTAVSVQMNRRRK